MTKAQKLKVGRRALQQRVARALVRQGKRLVADRATGRFSIVDGHVVTKSNLDLERLARELNVLKPYEQIKMKD